MEEEDSLRHVSEILQRSVKDTPEIRPNISLISNGNIVSEPSVPATVFDLNIRNQHAIQALLTLLEEWWSKNIAEQNFFVLQDVEKNEKEIKLRAKPMNIFQAPYFYDVRGFHAPIADDAKEKEVIGFTDAYLAPSDSWTTPEENAFLEIVEGEIRQSALKPFNLKALYLTHKKGNMSCPAVREALDEEIDKQHANMEEIRKMSCLELLNVADIKIDWLGISVVLQSQEIFRSNEECELIWNNCLHPQINRHKFTNWEDQCLNTLAKEHGETDWDTIAEKLNTNRTAIQCAERYHSCLNEKHSKRFWNAEEDKLLIDAVESCRIKKFIPWRKVSSAMHGWKYIQLVHRWDRCLRPQNREGSWIPEEDAILCLSVLKLGNRWIRIAGLSHGRSSYLCRERYTGVLDPDLLTGQWSWQEDKKLFKLLAIYGEKWGAISRYLHGRTDNMVNQRCTLLQRHKPELYDSILKSSPEDVEKKLPKKQFTKSKECLDINRKREKHRTEAFHCAKTVAEEVCDNKAEIEACNNFNDLNEAINIPMFNVIIEKLRAHCKQELKRPVPKYITTRGGDSNPYEANVASDDDASDDASEEIEDDVEEDKVLLDPGIKKEENASIQSSFDERIAPQAIVGYKRYIQTLNLKTPKQRIEYDQCCAFLYKEFKIKNRRMTSDVDQMDEDEISCDEKTVFRRIDYAKTIPEMITHFVLSASEKGRPPVIPMNVTTFKAVKMFFMTRSLMLLWVNKISPKATKIWNSFSDVNLEFPGMCYECPNAQMSFDSNPENQDDQRICVCDKIPKYRKKMLLLMYRFISVFMWVGLLSRIEPSEEQIDKLIVEHRKQAKSAYKTKKRMRLMKDDEEEEDDDDEDEDY